ncbi:hypothetical protein P3T73_16035 [Kiritimatiellota bacterium B12222]|nr:hypothetical protein P3T73_16035 [Kiritimatiellota bacterium B12222]
MKHFVSKIPLHSLCLLGMALLFSIPYRVSLWVQPAWLAYLGLTLGLCVLFGLFLCPTAPVKTPLTLRKYWLWVYVALLAVPRIYWMFRYPVAAEYGDMLPLIQLAGERFLDGGFPYTEYQLPWPLPLTFFPGLWMSYLPALSLGLDPRWVGLGCTLGCGMLLFKLSQTRLSLGVLLVFALLPVFTFFTVNGHTPPFWLMLCGFGFCSLRAMPLRAAACLGLALASRQTALILFPFAVLGWWRAYGLRGSLKPVLVTVGIVAVFCLPFFLIDADAFLLEPIRHYKELAQAYQQGAGDPSHLLDTFGFANIAYVTGTTGWLSWMRLGVWGLGLLGCLTFAKTPADHLRWMAVTALFFTLFTPVPWIYAYFPFWILACTAPYEPVAATR